MPAPTETVVAFLAACGGSKEEMRQACRTYFTSSTIWENVGLAVTTGVEEALAFMDSFEAGLGIAGFRAEILTIAARGKKVLTERIDYLVDADGRDVKAIRVMGIFEVEGGRIAAWHDYFDTAGLKS